MRIYVRVINMAQGQLGALNSQVAGTEAALNRASLASGRFHGSLATGRLTSWGKNLQWAGRQIEYNFTLPLVIAGAAAVHWSNQNEEAATKLKKVYGDATPAFQQLAKTEIPALRRAFVQLSNIMGISQAEILDMAATWAQAGVSGLALAKYTRLTAEAMILGEMSAGEASKALIQISAQYKLSADQLKDALAIMNAVENQTAASMNDLIVAFTKTAFLAQTTGIDVRHLAAMIAAITPAAGTGAQAGQALKTIIQSIIKPTKGAVQVMEAIGIQFNTSAWQSKSMTDRLQELSDKFKPLTANQKVYTASIIVGKFQANRFVALLDSMADKQGNYARALSVTNDMQKVHNIYAQELGTVLKSQPRAFDILKERMKNSLTEAIFPMIPALISIVAMLSKVTTAFGNMDPATQKMIVGFLFAIAIIGPFLRYLGAFALLIGELGKGLFWLTGRMVLFGAVTTATGVRVTFLSRILYFMRVAALTAAIALSRMFGLGSLATFFEGRMLALRASTIGAAMSQTVLGAAVGSAASLVIRGAGLIGQAFVFLYTNIFRSTLTFVATYARTLIAGLLAPFAAVGRSMLALWSVATTALAPAWAGVMGLLSRITTVAGQTITNIWAAFGAAFTRITAITGSTAIGIWQRLGSIFQMLWSAIGGNLLRLWTVTMTSMSTISMIGGNMISTVFTGIRAALYGLWASTGARLVGLSILTNLRMAAVFAGRTLLAGAVRGFGYVIGFISTTVVRSFAVAGRAMMMALGNPWVLAFAAIIGLVVHFHNQIGKAFSGIRDMVLKAFNALPQGVQNAFLAVIRVVSNAVKAVRDWMSELSPFKRHSPSTVDHVKAGSKTITKHYQKMGNEAAAGVDQGTAALQNFKNATAGASAGLEAADTAKMRKSVVAAAPNAGPAFDATSNAIRRLQAQLPAMEAAIAKQKIVVQQWKDALDAANKTLDVAQKRLDALQKVADAAEKKLQASKDALDAWANTPIVGMKKMDDAIFGNTLAANKLQLQILKLEDAGKGPEALADKFSKLMGDIDQLRGESANLRQMGAGSDVLGPINQQISAMDNQATSIANQQKAVGGLQEQYDALQRQGQILDLEKSIQFDPLTKQIQDFTNQAKEMPFATIMAGLQASQAEVNKNQVAYDAATAAVARQQAVVDSLTAARDALSDRYDAENDKLSAMNDLYQANVDKINDMKDALSSFTQQADQAADAAGKVKEPSDALKGLATAGLGSPKDAAGSENFQLGREGGMGDQSKQIDDLAKQWEAESNAAFSGLDMFKPFKDMWNSFIKWVDDHTGGLGTRIVNGIKKNLAGALAGAGLGFIFFGPLGAAIGFAVGALLQAAPWTKIGKAIGDFLGGPGFGGQIGDGLKTSFGLIQDWFNTIVGWIKDLFKLFGPDLFKFFDSIGAGIANIFAKLGESFSRLDLGRLGQAFHNVTAILKPIVGVMLLPMIAAFKVFASILANTVGPALRAVGALLRIPIDMLVGLINFLSAIFTGQWGAAWQAIVDMFKNIFGDIGDYIGAVGQFIVGIVKGIVSGIFGFFKWLWDVLLGHSIIPDIVNGIVSIFQWFGSIIGPIVQAAVTVITVIFNGLGWVLSNVLIPTLQFFGNIFGAIFNAIGAIISFWWNNITMPIFNLIVWMIQNLLIPYYQLLWSAVSFVFNAIGNLVVFVWNTLVQPIWNLMVWIIQNVLIPVFNAMGSVFGAIWNGIGNIVSWIWNHVVAPAWAALKWYWDNALHPAVNSMGAVFGAIWNGIGAVISWIWNHTVAPVWAALKWYWDNQLHPAVDVMGRVFGTVWNGIGNAISFVVNRVIKPALQAIIDFWNGPLKGALNGLLRGFASIFNNVGKAVAFGVGVAVDAINAIIHGIDWLADKLHLGIHINDFGKPGAPFWNPPQLARGGPIPQSEVGGGFMVNRARAIVGEGNPNYPEFVIPTDPRYRNRAHDLYKMAGRRLGAGPDEFASGGELKAHLGQSKYGVKAYGIGGWLEDKANKVIDDVKNAAGFIRKGAVTAAFAPFNAAFDLANKATPNEPVPLHDMAARTKDEVYNWAKGQDKDYGPNWEKEPPPGYQTWAEWASVMQGGFQGALGGAAWQLILQYARSKGAWHGGAVTSTGGTHVAGSYHYTGNAVDFGNVANPNQRQIFDTFDAVAGSLLELFWDPAGHYVKNGARIGGAIGGHGDHVHVAATADAMNRLLGRGVAPQGSYQQYAQLLLNQRGWGSQFGSLKNIIDRESGWDPTISNGGGHGYSPGRAYGIPQALPGSKMASAGPDWMTNGQTQLRWMMGYIASVYHDPNGAWAFWQRHHAYGTGGILPGYMKRMMDDPYGTNIVEKNARLGGVIPMSTVFRAANGALINPSPGGTLIRAGEGGQREAVVPLPNNLRSESGGDIHFHGDLSFPNVRTGDDARDFLDNLRRLGKR